MKNYHIVSNGLTLTLLCAGLIFSYALSSIAMAESIQNLPVPVPSVKPELNIEIIEEEAAPLPQFKPETQTENVAVEGDGFEIVSNAQDLKAKLFFSDRQVRLNKEIFDLQAQGNFVEANKKIKQLNNKILLGHILAERYLHLAEYNPTRSELSVWLKNYSDHPQASSIYKMALKQGGSGTANTLAKPVTYKKVSGNLSALSQKGNLYKTTKNRTSEQQSRVRKLKRDLAKNIKAQRLTLALNILSNDYATQFMDDVEFDHQRALIAAGYMYAGHLDQAKRVATQSMMRSGSNVPMAGWVKGLVEWQEGNYQKAATAFQSAASSQYASGWLISASAYWASRSHMRSGNAVLVSKWLDLAASYPRTYYGLVSIRAMGYKNDFNWMLPDLTREQRKVIEQTPQGKRAAALIKIGHHALAEAELKNLGFNDDVQKKRALLAYASKYNLPSVMMALGNSFSAPKGRFYDAALYPLMSFMRDENYIVDKALIHGFVRQESRFNQRIYNASGAVGLMQLMPKTANYVAGQDLYDGNKGRYLLGDAKTNLKIGQQYIQELLESRHVNNDLISLAIAYNAGPGNLRKWKNKHSQIKDPLLFIEMIPYPETRAFVERVLANYWIYKMRMNEPTPSLDAVAEGKWAVRVASKN